jgi:hypothetical protein
LNVPRPGRFAIGLVLLWAAVGVVDVAWLRRDTRPPSWDPANHLLSEVRYRNVLADALSGRAGIVAAGRALLRVDDHYPPLAPFAAAIASSPFAPRPDPATIVLGQMALGLLIFAVFRLGSALFSPETGAIAATAAATFPLLAGQSHSFMLDLPDAAMTSLAILALVRTDGFDRPRRALAFGLALGLALLTKWTCAFFVALPAAAALGNAIRGAERRRRIANAATALLTAAAVAAPWYLTHLWTLFRDTGKFAWAVGVREGDPPVWSRASLLYYPRELLPAATVAWTALFAAGAVVAIARDRKRSAVPLLWLLGGGTILTLIRNKDARYLMPMLPAVALLAASAVSRLRPRALRAAITGALAVAGIAAAWRRDPPRAERWPIADAVSWIRAASSGGPAPRLRIVPDLPSFERHAFELEAEAARFPLDVGTWFHFPAFADDVITKSGEQGERPEPSAIMDDIGSSSSSFPSVFRPEWRRPLPDGSVATIWVRDPSPVAESGAAISSRLEAAIREAVSRHASNVEGLSIAVETTDDEARRGRFSRIAVSLGSARVRTRLASPTAPSTTDADGIDVRGAGIEALGVAIDAPRLMRGGGIVLLAIREVVPRVAVTDGSIAAFLAARNPRGSVAVRFAGGRIEASGKWRPAAPDVEIAVVPRIVGASNIGWRIERATIAGLPVPSFVLEAILSGNNPILKPMPCRIRLDAIEVDAGVLAVNRPGAADSSARGPSAGPGDPSAR